MGLLHDASLNHSRMVNAKQLYDTPKYMCVLLRLHTYRHFFIYFFFTVTKCELMAFCFGLAKISSIRQCDQLKMAFNYPTTNLTMGILAERFKLFNLAAAINGLKSIVTGGSDLRFRTVSSISCYRACGGIR